MTGPDRAQGNFQEDPDPHHESAGSLVVALDAYEGPIDLLLEQAKAQKVDLTTISVLALADQYLAFIEHAVDLRIELAADYLVMAAWLAYLKSRLLVPPDEADTDEPSAEEMAEALTRRLQRLDAMRRAADKLLARRVLGRDWHPSGSEPAVSVIKTTLYDATLYDLLEAYADQQRPADVIDDTYRTRLNLVSVDEAVRRFRHLLGVFPGWNRLEGFLPKSLTDKLHSRSALASHFVAMLELAKAGTIDVRQDRPFAPIFVRATSNPRSIENHDDKDDD